MAHERQRKRVCDTRGVALVTTLLFSFVLLIISGIFMLRVTHENRMVDKEIGLQKTLYAAQAASYLALSRLSTFINVYLFDTISSANPSGVIQYTKQKVNQGRGVEWLVFSVRNAGNFVFYPNPVDNPAESQNPDQAEYSHAGTINDGDYLCPYQYDIIITENGKPYAAGVDAWEFPFLFKIIARAAYEGVTQSVYLSGNFTVQVQRDNFAKYSLFTNSQTTETGIRVWFTNNTNFAGPVHTNDRFNFARNPSGTFDGLVTQNDQRARFYNNGSPVLLDQDFNSSIDVPVFNAMFRRDYGLVDLASPVQQQDMDRQARGGKNINQDGIHLSANGNVLCGGIYVRGNGHITSSVNGEHPVYTITQGASTKRITIDYPQNTTIVETLAGDGPPTQAYQGVPNGQDDVGTLIFFNGTITGLSGTVQGNEGVTVASSGDMIITNHVRYENYTPAVGTPGSPGYVPPSASGTENLLGLVSWGGNVRIGAAAPDNIDIHATILARQGVFRVDGYDIGSLRGTATLLGGVISDSYGAFGTFDGTTGEHVTGYGRNFVYDDRMLAGFSPPYFPTLETFIAFTNDLTDRIIWQKGE